MKSLILICASILLLSVATANGQVFFGGNIGFNYNGGSNSVGGTSTDQTSTTIFTFSPMGGYFLSDKFAIGAQINISTNKVNIPGDGYVATSTTNLETSYGLSPFIRYYALTINKFSIFGQGYIALSLGSNSSTTGGVKTDGPSSTEFGFGIIPGISFDLTSKISLEATINLLNLGYTYNVSSLTTNGIENKNSTSNFYFGAGVNNIVNTGDIMIGAIIKL